MRVDLADWLGLNMIRGIGPRTANILLDRFGSPANIFAASRAALLGEGLKPPTIEQLHNTEMLEKAQIEIEKLEALGAQVITLADEAYPQLLREIYDPPIALYVKGDLKLLYCARQLRLWVQGAVRLMASMRQIFFRVSWLRRA